MVDKADLVIIGLSVGLGLAFGVLIAGLVFFGVRWYRRRANLRRCANECSVATLPIRTNGVGTSIDMSASLSDSVVVKEADYISQNLQHSWWSYRSKDRFASASGIPRFTYKAALFGMFCTSPRRSIVLMSDLGNNFIFGGYKLLGVHKRDIQRATQNFTTILGQGSFGPVYKAIIPTGAVVAVKVLASNSKQGEREFHTEVSLLARLHHRNLVNLIGYCVDKGQRMLIYEFMSNGSLANLLYDEDGRVLSWEERLQIALDISHGIEYLHDGAVPPVIHRDLKSANILLDHSMSAKVADFGLSKEEVFDGRNSGLKGTYGYIDPEYMSTNKFTMKSDIYSFGVILFELITAIHPHQNLMEYVNLAAMSPDGVDDILDKKIIGTCNPEDARSLASIAHKCLHETPRKRPSIGEVSQAILKIKQRRLIEEDTRSFAGADFSKVASHIEQQQLELTNVTTLGNNFTQ